MYCPMCRGHLNIRDGAVSKRSEPHPRSEERGVDARPAGPDAVKARNGAAHDGESTVDDAKLARQ